VEQVVAGSVAEQAGIKLNDEIIHVNGSPVGISSLLSIGEIFRTKTATSTTFEVKREGVSKNVSIVIKLPEFSVQ
jgi:C-terminal processing protease CtpA/Prc